VEHEIVSEPTTGWRRLVGNALVVALAGGFANVLNLGLTFVVARLLSPTNYAAYAQMVGVFFVVALPGSALGVAVVRRAGYYIVRGDHVLTLHWQRRLHQRVMAAAVTCGVIALPISVVAASWLGHRSWVAVWMIGLAGLTFTVLSVDRALLQSRQRYGSLASNFVVEGLARTILILVGVSVGVTGYAIGLLLAEAVTRLHAYRLVRHRIEVDHGIELEHTGITRELMVALVTLGCMAVLQFLDVFVIGHDSPHGAGSYTAIAQVAKTMVYGATILGSFLLPEAVLANRKGADALRQLGVVLALLAVPAAVLAVVAGFFARPTLRLVFGARYSHAAGSLETLLGAMILLSVSTILVTFLLGDGARWPTLWIAICTLGGAFWMVAGHGQWRSTAERNLEIQAAVLVGLTIAVALRLRRHGRLAAP
jgi:O-antigen/teichoic acid export membrane protein